MFNRYLTRINCVLMCCGCLFMSGCDEQQQTTSTTGPSLTTVKIAVSTTPLSAPFYVAQANGYFTEQGLNVAFVDTIGGNRCLQKVLDAEVDMGTASDYPVMIKSFAHKDFTIAATFVSSVNDVKLIASKKNGINEPAELKNKIIGTVTGASSHYFLDRFLLLNNMSLADVNVIHVDPEAQPAALANGDVDALSVWEPYAYLAKNALQHDSVIFSSGEYYRETFNLVMNKDYIKNNADTVRKVLLGLASAIEFIKQQPDKAQQLLVKRLKLDNAFIDWIWDDYDFALTLDQSLLNTLENEARWALQHGIVNNGTAVNYLDYVDTGILKDIGGARITIIQ